MLLLFMVAHAAAPACRADEGFWLPNKIPSERLARTMGFTATPGWKTHWQRSSLGISANADSGSFVSPDGLVLTNWHVALHYLQAISSGTTNYARDGFRAVDRHAEIPLPGLKLYSEAWDDVTEEARYALAAATSPPAAVLAELAEGYKDGYYDEAEIRDTTYGSGYVLHRTKSFDDIRLVMAPEYGAAFFGGETDNFEFPRFCLDMIFLRVYQNGAPVKSPDHFRFSKAGVREGDLVFAAGWPAVTERRKSLEELEFQRDYFLPNAIALGSRTIKTYEAHYSKNPRAKDQEATEKIFKLGNDLKRHEGQLKELQDPETLAIKALRQTELRRIIAKDPEMSKKYGELFDEIKELMRGYSEVYPRYHNGKDWTSQLAKNLFSLLKELDREGRAPKDKLPQSVIKKLFLKPVFDAGLEERLFRSDLEAAMTVPGRDPKYVEALLTAGNPEQTARELVTGTKYVDAGFRKELLAGGWEALLRSEDPLIKWALTVYALRRNDLKQEEALVGRLKELSALHIKAQAEVLGNSFYPDPDWDMILRLSYGKVAGYRDGGEEIPYLTTFGGMYKKAAARDNIPPYALPASLGRGDIPPDTPLNFVSTIDMSGGNSGSPVFDRSGELAGIIFDGNAQASRWTYVYSEEQGRSVILDARAITNALSRIYGMGYLVDELTK